MGLLSSIFGGGKRRGNLSTPLDLVSYAASLASNPTDIDPVLDKVRAVTSQLSPGQVPSAQDDQVLLGVYVQIEQYLTTKEPIRTYNKDVLRARLTPELHGRLEAYERVTGRATPS